MVKKDSPLPDLLLAAINSKIEQVRTSDVAIVREFKAPKDGAPTVTVQPCFNHAGFDEDGKKYSIKSGLISDVPVMFPGSDDWLMTFPLKPGSAVLLVNTKHDIHDFLNGDIGDDGIYTSIGDQALFAGGSCVAIPVVRPSKQVIENFNNNDIEIRSRDGSTTFTVGTESIKTNKDIVFKAGDNDVSLSEFVQKFNAHTHVSSEAGTDSSEPSERV